MRSRVALIASVFLVAVIALPLAAHAQSIPFFGPVVPDSCPLGWGAVLVVINNIIRLLLTLLIVFVAPIMIAWAGFLLVAYSVNPAGKERARSLITNLIIGLVVALAGWLIVDLIIVTLTVGSFDGKKWWEIISTGGQDICLEITVRPSPAAPAPSGPAPVTTLPFAPLPRIASCNPDAIMAAAKVGGYQLTQAEANTFSCLALPESSCRPNAGGATTVNGTPTTATGLLQIVLGINDTCHNLNLQVCTDAARAAGYTVTGNLNCSTAFQGGTVKPGMENLAKACKAAAVNVNCNVSAAACILRADRDYGAWTADPRSTTQQACIQQYSGLTKIPTPLEYFFSLLTL